MTRFFTADSFDVARERAWGMFLWTTSLHGGLLDAARAENLDLLVTPGIRRRGPEAGRSANQRHDPHDQADNRADDGERQQHNDHEIPVDRALRKVVREDLR